MLADLRRKITVFSSVSANRQQVASLSLIGDEARRRACHTWFDFMQISSEMVPRPETPDSTSTPAVACSDAVRVAVGIATRGRAQVLMATLSSLREQTLRPVAVLVAYAQASDIADAPQRFPEVTFVQSLPGLTCQRNAILTSLPAVEVLVFFDDDFLMRPDYLARMKWTFAEHAEVVVATGHVLADGINGPGLTVAEGQEMVARAPGVQAQEERLVPVFNAYGCNMALRVAPIVARQLRFNEDLPLYGWYEDVEFSRQMASFGDVVKVPSAQGVHLGVKGGRQSGVRLGYSQVANPVYLARRRSVPWSYAIASMVSRSVKNLMRSLRPEPFVDRRGRLKGNLQGWRDLVQGTLHPQRAAQL